MALAIPNLDNLTEDNPRLGEALKMVQNYTNQNVTAVPGNKIPPPPKSLANPSGKP